MYYTGLQIIMWYVVQMSTQMIRTHGSSNDSVLLKRYYSYTTQIILGIEVPFNLGPYLNYVPKYVQKFCTCIQYNDFF